jgi:hypothetical protein
VRPYHGWGGREHDGPEPDGLRPRADGQEGEGAPTPAPAPGEGGAVPVPALRALLAELDVWPVRPTAFEDACDRLSDLIATYGGETPDCPAAVAWTAARWPAAGAGPAPAPLKASAGEDGEEAPIEC